MLGFPGSSAGQESTCNTEDPALNPGLGRSPGEGKGLPLQYSGLENSMDCIVLGVKKSRTRLSDFHFSCHTGEPKTNTTVCTSQGKQVTKRRGLSEESIFSPSSYLNKVLSIQTPANQNNLSGVPFIVFPSSIPPGVFALLTVSGLLKRLSICFQDSWVFSL